MSDHLTEEEMELLDSFEKGEWISKSNLDIRKQQLQEYAKNTLNQKPVQIFIPEQDFKAIQTKALEEGIPYKTLISNILHQYVYGKLIVQ